jgi:hypothetical protein
MVSRPTVTRSVSPAVRVGFFREDHAPLPLQELDLHTTQSSLAFGNLDGYRRAFADHRNCGFHADFGRRADPKDLHCQTGEHKQPG